MDSLIQSLDNLGVFGVDNSLPIQLRGYLCADELNYDFEFIVSEKNGINIEIATDCIIESYGIENVLCESEIKIDKNNSYIRFYHWGNKIPHCLEYIGHTFPLGFWISEPKNDCTLHSIGSAVFREGFSFSDMFKLGNIGEIELFNTCEANVEVIY